MWAEDQSNYTLSERKFLMVAKISHLLHSSDAGPYVMAVGEMAVSESAWLGDEVPEVVCHSSSTAFHVTSSEENGLYLLLAG